MCENGNSARDKHGKKFHRRGLPRCKQEIAQELTTGTLLLVPTAGLDAVVFDLEGPAPFPHGLVLKKGANIC